MERMKMRPCLLLYPLHPWVENPLLVRDSLCVLEDGPTAVIKGISRQSKKHEEPGSTVMAAKGSRVAHSLVREVGRSPISLMVQKAFVRRLSRVCPPCLAMTQ